MLIYIGVYIVGNDTDVNGKKMPHSDDTAVKVVNIIIRFILFISVILILIGGWNIDRFVK